MSLFEYNKRAVFKDLSSSLLLLPNSARFCPLLRNSTGLRRKGQKRNRLDEGSKALPLQKSQGAFGVKMFSLFDPLNFDTRPSFFFPASYLCSAAKVRRGLVGCPASLTKAPQQSTQGKQRRNAFFSTAGSEYSNQKLNNAVRTLGNNKVTKWSSSPFLCKAEAKGDKQSNFSDVPVNFSASKQNEPKNLLESTLSSQTKKPKAFSVNKFGEEGKTNKTFVYAKNNQPINEGLGFPTFISELFKPGATKDQGNSSSTEFSNKGVFSSRKLTQGPLQSQEGSLQNQMEKHVVGQNDNKRSEEQKRSGLNLRGYSTLQESDKKKQEVVSITYEEIGLFPRSFSRVLDRFLKQIFSDVENLVIQEYRFYRYLFLTTLKCLLILFFVPVFVNFIAKTYIVRPLTEYVWNTKQTEIFLNSYQQKRAFAELKDFEEKIYFESLIYPRSAFLVSHHSSPLEQSGKVPFASNTSYSSGEGHAASVPSTVGFSKEGTTANTYSGSFAETKTQKEGKVSFANVPVQETLEGKGNLNNYIDQKGDLALINSYTLKSSLFVYQTIEADKNIQQRYQEKTIELAQRYNDQSIEAITNLFADLISLSCFFYLLYALEIQINITKSFLLEVFFGLDDSKKSLLILLVTDLLVGYHSSNLWELFFEFLFHHYGLPESQTGIFLLVATLPVLLDVLFKYLIFRHLNRSSPATVATYHAMIE